MTEYKINLETKTSKSLEEFSSLLKTSPEKLVEKIVNKEIAWMKSQIKNHQCVIFEDYPIVM